MAIQTREPSVVQTVYRERAVRSDVRKLAPATGLLEYWYPAIEDRKVGNKPVGLKICNELLVFFRGKDKQVKALHNVCPHRGGSLMHGDCHFEGTISCPYHGWTYDGDGNVLAVLPEGPDSQVPGKVRQRTYPTRTLRGMVFVWMGEDEPAPIEEDVPPEFFTDEGQMLYAWEVWPVNWRVAVENAGRCARALRSPRCRPRPHEPHDSGGKPQSADQHHQRAHGDLRHTARTAAACRWNQRSGRRQAHIRPTVGIPIPLP